MSWHSALSSCLEGWYPIGTQVLVPASSPLVQLPAYGSVKAVEDSSI